MSRRGFATVVQTVYGLFKKYQMLPALWVFKRLFEHLRCLIVFLPAPFFFCTLPLAYYC